MTTAKADMTVDALVDVMVQEIQAGVFAPGMWLKQIDLETRYGAKRMEVRRALDQLAAKRLVRHVPNRGYHVHEPDDRQTDEIREVRLILELGAVNSIVERATQADVADLRSLAERFDALVLTGTILEQYEANIAFHERLLGLCANRELCNLVMELRSRSPSAPVTQWRTRARVEQSGREHGAMVEAVANRDAVALRRLLMAHIRQMPDLASAAHAGA